MPKVLRVESGANFTERTKYDDEDVIVEELEKEGLESLCGFTAEHFVFAKKVLDNDVLKELVEVAIEEAFQQGQKVKRKAIKDRVKRELLATAPVKVKRVLVEETTEGYVDVYGLHKKFLEHCWCLAPTHEDLKLLWEARNKPCDCITVEKDEWKRTFKGEGNEDQVVEAVEEGGKVTKFRGEVDFSLDENGYLVIGYKGEVDLNAVWEDAQAILGKE